MCYRPLLYLLDAEDAVGGATNYGAAAIIITCVERKISSTSRNKIKYLLRQLRFSSEDNFVNFELQSRLEVFHHI